MENVNEDIKLEKTNILTKFNLTNYKGTECTIVFNPNTENFIILIIRDIYIVNYNGDILTKCRVNLDGKIIKLKYNLFNNYILLINDKHKCSLIDLMQKDKIKYFEIYENIEILDAFFINKREKPYSEKFKICLILASKFLICKVKNNSGKTELINYYMSKQITYNNVYYNEEFCLIMFRLKNNNFLLFNLKCYSGCENEIYLDCLLDKTKEENPKILLKNIYDKLYFITIYSSYLEYRKLSNLNKIKDTLKITFNDKKKENANILNNIQFFDHLIILYINSTIVKIYDIKLGYNNELINTINIPESFYNMYIKNSIIYNKYILTSNYEIYSISFNNNNFYLKVKEKEVENFFISLRRISGYDKTKEIFTDLVEKNAITKIYAIIINLIGIRKKMQKIKTNNKSDIKKIKSLNKEDYYLDSNSLLTLFSSNIEKQEPLRVIEIIILICNLYKKNKIKIEDDMVLSALISQLNKMEDFSSLEFFIRNNSLPISTQFAFYFLARARMLKSKHDKTIAFNLGTEMLKNNMNHNIELINELLLESKFEFLYDFIYEKYLQNENKTTIKKSKKINLSLNDVYNFKIFFIKNLLKFEERKYNFSKRNIINEFFNIE